jgi:glycogen debranching enzyme
MIIMLPHGHYPLARIGPILDGLRRTGSSPADRRTRTVAGMQWKTLFAGRVAEPVGESPVFASGHDRHDAAYAKATADIEGDIVRGRFIAGRDWNQLWTRDTAYAVDAGAGLLHPAVAMATLRDMTKRGRRGVVWRQDSCGHFGGWPNLTDAIVGAVGAWSLYTTTGDQEFLRWSHDVTVNSLARAEREVFDSSSGLFTGCSTFMESNSGYPAKYAHNGSLMGKTKALSTNLLHYRGYVLAARMARLLGEDVGASEVKAAKLKDAVNTRLWRQDKGYYAYYEDENGVASDRMEGTGESFAILWGVADAERASVVLANTPVTSQGIPSLWPQYPEWTNYAKRSDSDYYHNGMVWPFVQGYWARAAGARRDIGRFGAELDKLLELSEKDTTYSEFYLPEDGRPGGSPRQLWSATGYLSMVHHGLFGMDFEPDAIRFTPLVPREFADLSLTGLRYREMTLDLRLTGSGGKVRHFALDGEPRKDHSVPSGDTGHHEVTITVGD